MENDQDDVLIQGTKFTELKSPQIGVEVDINGLIKQLNETQFEEFYVNEEKDLHNLCDVILNAISYQETNY